MKALSVFAMLGAMATCLFAKEVSITVEGKTLKGELNHGKEESTKVAFIISGSGPTDRDGNTQGFPGKSNCLKYLSEDLNARGISTLRVDKRGVGASAVAATAEKDLRFSTYVDDAKQWIGLLEKEGFSEIVLVGHSEGALVATLAAKHKSVDGLVSIAGVGRPAGELLREQLKSKLPKALNENANKVIDSLSKGKTTTEFSPALASIFRSSVQPYLISWFEIDPVKEMAELTIPVQIVHGVNDLQVSMSDAKSLKESAKNGRIVFIGKMNHVLKQVEALDMKGQQASYVDPKIPLNEDVGRVIAAFINEQESQ